jgi:tRNA-splicing ligase RtcB
MAQIRNLADHPVIRKIAVMPDCHQGYGMPIGGVIACEKAVIPNAVGVDIGCGMMATQTALPAEMLNAEQVEKILHSVSRDVPVGFKHRNKPVEWENIEALEPPDDPIVKAELTSGAKQLGTLGGGNHFIEIQAGDDGLVWLMIHSGSRNIGYTIANHYNELAGVMNVTWKSRVPHKDLCFLPTSSVEGQQYIAAMEFAQRFAMRNREIMMDFFKQAFMHEMKAGFRHEVNIHHNFAQLEHHNGRDYWIHRKGATQAQDGQWGIIPGSMGTSSYIVQGKGNPDSMKSCSHGAGRRMGRGEFNRGTTLEEANASIEGVVFKGWGKKRRGGLDFSEAPGAYKDIDEVMAQQTDLVEIKVKLTPLGVLKG